MASSNSKQATVGTAATSVTWPSFYEQIVVTNLGSAAVYITTDGTAAVVGAANTDVILPGQVAMFANRQPKLYTVTTAPGSTSQNIQNPSSGFPTLVSLISGTAGQLVTISPQ